MESEGTPSFLSVNGNKNNSMTYYMMKSMASNGIRGDSLLPQDKSKNCLDLHKESSLGMGVYAIERSYPKVDVGQI